MRNGDQDGRYRSHSVRDVGEVPIRTSLGRAAAVAPESTPQLRQRAADVWRAGGGVMFFEEQLRAMPAHERALIERMGIKFYGER